MAAYWLSVRYCFALSEYAFTDAFRLSTSSEASFAPSLIPAIHSDFFSPSPASRKDSYACFIWVMDAVVFSISSIRFVPKTFLMEASISPALRAISPKCLSRLVFASFSCLFFSSSVFLAASAASSPYFLAASAVPAILSATFPEANHPARPPTPAPISAPAAVPITGTTLPSAAPAAAPAPTPASLVPPFA